MPIRRFARVLPLVVLPLTFVLASCFEQAVNAHTDVHTVTAVVVEEQALLVALAQAQHATQSYIAANGSATTRSCDDTLRLVDLHLGRLAAMAGSDPTRARGTHQLEILARRERENFSVAIAAEQAGSRETAALTLARADKDRLAERLRASSATFELAESRREDAAPAQHSVAP